MEMRVVLISCAVRLPSVWGGVLWSAVLLIECRCAPSATVLDVRRTGKHLAGRSRKPIALEHRCQGHSRTLALRTVLSRAFALPVNPSVPDP